MSVREKVIITLELDSDRDVVPFIIRGAAAVRAYFTTSSPLEIPTLTDMAISVTFRPCVDAPGGSP